MKTLAEIKDLEQTDCPLLLFDCELVSGKKEHWSTHAIVLGGQSYDARILQHSGFELRSGTTDGIDATGRVTVVLANADGRFSELEYGTGWKGARLTVRFVFFDLAGGIATSEAAVVFCGIANPPDDITESTFRLTFSNRMSLLRLQLPEVRIQRRCPWIFPATLDQRIEAVDGGARGQYSPFYHCGYSADVPGGLGLLQEGRAFSSCNYTRAACEARGMFASPAQRFGGVEYLPSTIDVRTYGAKERHSSAPVDNTARYDDFVPLVYGTGWFDPVTIFARNDGNLTRMEVLLGAGRMQGLLKVLVNGIEIPAANPGQDMTATGWYSITATGQRDGGFNPDFPDGDPYGSMAVAAIVVPNRIADGSTVPKVRVLAQGKWLERFDSSGTSLGEMFTNNPAWVILDVLRKAGWTLSEIDIASFATAAAYCDERIVSIDGLGNETTIPRYQCNLILTKRRSAGDVIRGIRAGSGLYLSFGFDGRLRLRAEATLAEQQPTKAPTSNSQEALSGGWPAYEFGDGTYGYGGILCGQDGAPVIRFWSRSSAETVNRLSIEFQDEQNEYQQDSVSLIDADDFLVTGQEIDGGLTALGMPNFSQALRTLRRQLNRSVRGNRYVEFETSVKGLGLAPGDLISLTYPRESYDRQLFRIVSISPGLNYRTIRITAQLHDDSWYSNDLEAGPAGGRQPSSTVAVPRPLAGAIELHETSSMGGDGTIRLALTAKFRRPEPAGSTMRGVPLIALTPSVDTEGGTIGGGLVSYYAVTGVAADGVQSALSFTVAARTSTASDNNKISLTGLSFPQSATAYHVYRGTTPWTLSRIADSTPVGTVFEDTGLPNGTVSPPDSSYDHANVYWRIQTQPALAVSGASAGTLTSSALHANENSLSGMIVRISSGPGAGQERSIASNTESTLHCSQPWVVIPDTASEFTVSEAGWRFGASTQGNSASFDIPNEPGRQLEVSVRAANVVDREAAYELSPLASWTIGGRGVIDDDVAGMPKFTMATASRGLVELSKIGFDSLANTGSIQAGTLGLHYRDELDPGPRPRLASPIDESGDSLALLGESALTVNSLLQIDAEIVRVEAIEPDGAGFRVTRGVYGTTKTEHDANSPITCLQRKVVTIGFPKGFFNSPAAESFRSSTDLPSATIAAATLSVTNAQGNSPTATVAYTGEPGGGLRTFGGGQLCLQVAGLLTIENNLTPPLIVQESTSVRDVFASVAQPSTDGAIEVEVTLDGAAYCTLTIPAGASNSEALPGYLIGALPSKGVLGLNITGITQVPGASPGRDLTVTIRV